jgi:hypothetical protein
MQNDRVAREHTKRASANPVIADEFIKNQKNRLLKACHDYALSTIAESDSDFAIGFNHGVMTMLRFIEGLFNE